MSRRQDRIDKLRRLSESPNVHEAARAREALADLLAKGPDPAAAKPRRPGPLDRDPSYPDQLPGAFRAPIPLGRRSVQ